MDVAYINPFIVATRNVFDTMVHVPVVLGKPYLKEHHELQNVVAASINLSGAVAGCIAINFTQPAALALAGGLAGAPLGVINSDCIDALGEIASMIAGNAKKDLPADGLTSISTPKIVLGVNKVEHPHGLPVLVVPCETPKGRFSLEVALKKGKEGKGA